MRSGTGVMVRTRRPTDRPLSWSDQLESVPTWPAVSVTIDCTSRGAATDHVGRECDRSR